MKKLIPALCMLLVAACLMGTSTYAWFAANTQVTASGMEVKALSSGGLAIGSYNYDADTGVISAPAEADFGSSATIAAGDYVVGAEAIKPVSFNKNHAAPEWFTAAAANAENGAATEGFAALIADAKAADATPEKFEQNELDAALANYVNKTTWDVKSLKDGYMVDVVVTNVTVEGVSTSATLDKALRVAFVTDEAAYIFAPVVGSTNLEYVTAILSTEVTEEDENGDEVTTTVYSFDTESAGLYTGTTNYGGTAKIFTGLTVDAEKVEVYVYYEGQDENCKSANATNIDELSVTFKLNALNERVESN